MIGDGYDNWWRVERCCYKSSWRDVLMDVFAPDSEQAVKIAKTSLMTAGYDLKDCALTKAVRITGPTPDRVTP